MHLGAVKNLLWSIQVKDCRIYPEDRGYKQVSCEKASGGKFIFYLISESHRQESQYALGSAKLTLGSTSRKIPAEKYSLKFYLESGQIRERVNKSIKCHSLNYNTGGMKIFVL